MRKEGRKEGRHEGKRERDKVKKCSIFRSGAERSGAEREIW
jgi:hypothetical protein